MSFRLIGNTTLAHELGNYETSEDLVIDPLIYSTFVGGSEWEEGHGIVLDSENNAYITGRTYSSDFPTTSGSFDESHNGNLDVVVFILNSDGSELLYSTFVGGIDDDELAGIALDNQNNVYITGRTQSPDFPTTPGSFDDSYNGDSDIFIFKLNSDGSDLVYSTYVGGNEWDVSGVIVLDTENNAYMTGATSSSDFPTTSGSFDESYNGGLINGLDGFVFKLNQDGSDLIYSTYIGGVVGDDFGGGITLDTENNAYITGGTLSPDFPTTWDSYDLTYNGGTYTGDVFVSKLNSDGSDLLYSTFIGGIDDDAGGSITLDSENNAYITGETASSNFPTTSGAFDNTHNGGVEDVFVSKLNSAGSDLLYSTFVGGSSRDYSQFQGFALDAENNAYITGSTRSPDFPTTSGSFDESHNGDWDIFVFKLNSDGSDLLYSTFVGGSELDWGWDLVLDPENNAYITGRTSSSEFPTTSGSYDESHNGNWDVIVFKLNLGEPTVIDGPEDSGGDDDVGPLGLSTTTWLLIGASVALASVGGGVLVWRRRG